GQGKEIVSLLKGKRFRLTTHFKELRRTNVKDVYRVTVSTRSTRTKWTTCKVHFTKKEPGQNLEQSLYTF
uniref:Uncharacterized protein n=1 Tax=Mastacembelus armatus TaxID=205130 RepID=A0A3Q3LVF2_9TELE